MTGKITASSENITGQVKTRHYEFTGLCPNIACSRVRLRREGPNANHFKSILHRHGSRLYRGTENSGRLNCPDGGKATQRVRFRFRVKRAEAGVPVEITGKARFDQHCPGGDVFSKARLYGTRMG